MLKNANTDGGKKQSRERRREGRRLREPATSCIPSQSPRYRRRRAVATVLPPPWPSPLFQPSEENIVTCHIDMEPNNHENDGGQCDWKPRVRMTFDTEQEVYDFYNSYGGRLGFSIRRGYVNKSKEGQITSRQFVCNKEGFRVVDKRDPLTKNPRQEVRTGCQARLVIKWDRNIQKFFVSDFVEQHNHIFVPTECTHMLPSQRKIFASQATEIDLAEKSGIRLNAAFELMGNEVGGRESLGFTKLDQKNYLRTKRQNSLAYGEAGSILQYFRDKSLENPSFFYSVQLDNEEQITNIFWADAQMIMDYGQFGDVVTFDTTYKLNSAHRPFASFVGFNHHRETVIFGAALMYDETADSFVWLFRRFLEAMSSKAPKTIFTDQDAAMAKAIPVVMPNTTHRLCTWHLMQNALRHANSIFKDKATVKDKGIKSVLSTFMYDIEDEEEFTLKWEEMLDKYEVRDNHWLKLTFGVKEKWGWPYVRNAWGASMSSTQLSESFNAFLKDFIQSDHNLMQFFMHFDRVLSEKRYKELQAEYALCQKLPRVNIKVKIMEQAADVYTNKIFEEFQDEYVKSLEVNIEEIENDGDSTVYTVLDSDGIKVRKVRQECDDLVSCSCRKFEMKGILCSHCLKILRERLKFKEIPSQYILKRWTKKARSENVKDRCGHDIQVDVRLHQTSRYRSLMAIFRSVACRASESEETYNLTVEKADELIADIETMLSAKFNMPCSDTIQESPPESFEVDGVADNNVVQAKGLKRRECTSKGRRRIKGGLELALAKKNKTSSYNASQTSMSVTPQSPPLFSASAPEAPPLFHQSAPLFSSAPQLPPFSPSVPEVRASSSQFMYPAYDPSFPHHNMHFSMPSMYSVHGTYQALLNNASSYHSQASNSPACSEVLYARGRGRGPFHPIALMHLNNIASWQGIKVAVKKLGEEVTADEDKVRAFRDELELLQKIRHGDLCDFLKRKGALKPTTAVIFALDIASVLISKQSHLGFETAMQGYDRDDYGDLDEYEEDGEEQEEDGIGEGEYEEEEAPQTTKQIKKESGSGHANSQEKKKKLPYDNYGSFFGPSQPVIAQRVIQESKSLLENHHLAPKVSKSNHDKSKSLASTTAGSKTQARNHHPKVVNQLKTKVQKIKDTRDYSFLLSDDAELLAPTKDPPIRNVSVSNSELLAPTKDPPIRNVSVSNSAQVPPKSRQWSTKTGRQVPNSREERKPMSTGSQTHPKTGPRKLISAGKPIPTSVDSRKQLGNNNGSGPGRPLGPKGLPSKMPAATTERRVAAPQRQSLDQKPSVHRPPSSKLHSSAPSFCSKAILGPEKGSSGI
ncbi:unnamed protein product [Camellia sinensis]